MGAVHAGGYVDRFDRAVAAGAGHLDTADNPLSPGTWRAAWGAVAAALHAADWALDKPNREAFVAVRPPGHHAERAGAMGFCYLNNVAVLADHLRRRHGASRIAIVDFDVHHGNGTQHIFETEADTLYASLHRWPFYPGTGHESEVGRGDGRGATVNVTLAEGDGDDRFLYALEAHILPAVVAHAPDVLLVSAGFDAWKRDPLGGLRVSEEGYARCGTLLRQAATEVCGGRMISLLEGGYDLDALPSLVGCYLEGG